MRGRCSVQATERRPQQSIILLSVYQIALIEARVKRTDSQAKYFQQTQKRKG